MTAQLTRSALLPVFVASSLVSAALLFVVQPMAAKQILPSFGGSPAVWNSSVLFFQSALLLGYLYTHVVTRRLNPRVQIVLHLVLLIAAVVVLPIDVSASTGGDETAAVIGRLLLGLLIGVGFPFVLISSSGPLLQRWLSWTSHPRADDPYFLYAASNLGSFVGLLAYPFLLEPLTTLGTQKVWWSVGYGILVVLFVAAGIATWRTVGSNGSHVAGPTDRSAAPFTLRESVRWMALAFIPSSLMLGVTTFITTDLAAVPLLWVVPLALYLATFTVAFGQRSGRTAAVAMRVAPAAALAAGAFWVGRLSAWLSASALLLLFSCLAMILHQRLADSRPATDRLTGYYLLVSVGGALGGLLNGLVAPVLFDGLFEYAGVLMWAMLLITVPLSTLQRQYGSAMRLLLTAGALVPAAVLAWAAYVGELRHPAILVVAAGLLVAVAANPVARSPVAMSVAIGLLLAPLIRTHLIDRPFVTERTFFGVYAVQDMEGARVLMHGTTLHGTQTRGTTDDQIPQSYYHPGGPFGDVFELPAARGTVGVVGLGTGALAAYTEAGQEMVFYEIDPVMVDLAGERGGFSFLQESAGDVGIVLGDGRLSLADVPARAHDLIVLDAFSSDAIPVHLLTVEAVEIYLRALKSEGVLAFHISNRYLDLEPMLAGAADQLGLTGLVGAGRGDSRFAAEAVVLVLARSESALSGLDRGRWRPLERDRRVLWTDSYSSLFAVLR